MCPARFIAGIFAEFKEIFDVRMPCFQIDTTRTLAASTLIHGGDGSIKRFKPGNDAI